MSATLLLADAGPACTAFSVRLVLRMLVAAALAVAAGCSTASRVDFTVKEQSIAEIRGFPDVRFWGDGNFDDFTRAGVAPAKRPGKPIQVLAISGGGSAGAFGAGVLVGLTESGTRPDFDAVSGVSTGALIAPFAFLGPAYDDELKTIYTSGVTKDLFKPKPLLSGLFGSGLVGSGPLRRLVEKYADRKLMGAVAAEDRKGRRLIVITTNMDSQRPVVWNMGKIASSRQPGALKLFQDVLIASASIPAVLPPVLIDVEVKGKRLREMHSDGGTASQVFAIPDGVLAGSKSGVLPKNAGRAELYMIVNYTLFPEFEVTKDKTLQVALRGLSTLMKAQTRSAVIATYGYTKSVGMRFNLASIDKIVPYNVADAFNTEYMLTLYEYGHSRAVAGTVWHSDPIADLTLRTAQTDPAAVSVRREVGTATVTQPLQRRLAPAGT